MGGFTPLEDFITQGLQTSLDPVAAGLLVMFLFLGIIFVRGFRFDTITALALPALIFSSMLVGIGDFTVMIIMAVSIGLFLALYRIFNK